MQRMHLDDLDLSQLRLLQAIVELRSVSAAAARVGLSQSAASHALARLRARLADPIVVRTSRGMSPTPFGERAGASVRAALDALRAGLEVAEDFDPATSRRAFQVFMSDVGQMVFLPRLLGHLAAHAPGTTLRVRQVPVEPPRAALESGEVDLAVGYFTALRNGFRQRLLFRERYVCVVRAGHPRFRDGMTLEAFRSVPQARADSSGMAHALLERVLERHRVRRPIRLAVPQFMVLPLVIAESDLLVIMPARLAAQFARLVPLQVMAPPVKIAAYDIKLFWHERFQRDAANRWLREALVALFAGEERPAPHDAV